MNLLQNVSWLQTLFVLVVADWHFGTLHVEPWKSLPRCREQKVSLRAINNDSAKSIAVYEA